MFSKLILAVPLALTITAPAAADDPVKKAENWLKQWRAPDAAGPTCRDFLAVGSDSIQVDVSSPGDAAPSFRCVPATPVFHKHCQLLLIPMVSEGVFRSTPFCKAVVQGARCTLMTPASVPRVLSFSLSEGCLLLNSVEWQRKAKRSLPPDDDLLPM